MVSSEYWLIAQHDHAQISGELAGYIGKGTVKAPSSPDVIRGIALHDCGWPIHDNHPTLNLKRQPLDVFETPPDIGLKVWDAAVERALEDSPYAGLLVSLHGLALSVFATGASPLGVDNKWNLNLPRVRFDVNCFQHKMIELQENLRRQLGMRTDIPLAHGLAVDSKEPLEMQLVQDFRLLQGMDQLSLAICCTVPPFNIIQPIGVKVDRPSESLLRIDPWPFEMDRIAVEVPFKRLPAGEFADVSEFQKQYRAASVERFTVALEPFTI